MGILTSDMTRLCDEISALRGAREALMKDLAHGAKDLKDAVSGMKAGFCNAHAEMARKTKAERVAFVSSLKKTVSGMRKGSTADIAGARRAWFGPPPAERKAMELKEQRRAEAEARRRKEEEEQRRKEAQEKRIKEDRRRIEDEARRMKEEGKRKAKEG